jgi:hypothetical protein
MVQILNSSIKDEMGGACGIRGRDEKCIKNLSLKS